MPKRKPKVENEEAQEVKKPQKDKSIKLNREQQGVAEALNNYDLVFVEGIYGTGKSLSCVYAALQQLKYSSFEKIVITRPYIADKGLGSLPGAASEKLCFEMQPILDNFYEIIGQNETEKLISEGVIKIQYSGKVKGATMQDAIFLVDENQDQSWQQFVRLLTRLGSRSKMICTMSKEQIDDSVGDKSCYYDLVHLKNCDFVGWIELFQNHRHGLINQVIEYVEEKRNGN
jgi:phosphate starvation-inducible protein PhoH